MKLLIMFNTHSIIAKADLSVAAVIGISIGTAVGVNIILLIIIVAIIYKFFKRRTECKDELFLLKKLSFFYFNYFEKQL